MPALGYAYEPMSRARLTQEDLDAFRKHNIGQYLLEVAKDFQKRALVAFAEAGHDRVQPAHQAVLTYLRLSGTRLTELAERASMTKQAMGQLVDELERLGYVERIPDSSDGRAKIVRFTPAGLELIEIGTEIGSRINTEYAALIGRQKLRQLHDLLAELHAETRRERAAQRSSSSSSPAISSKTS